MRPLRIVGLSMLICLCAAPAAEAAFVFEGKFGGSGIGDGLFGAPQGLAIGPAGNLYITDIGAGYIQKFSPSGAFLDRFSGPGGGNGQLSSPGGVTVDSIGIVIVADAGNSRIQVFSAGGGYLNKWGIAGAADGQFVFPTGVALATDAGDVPHIYVADQVNARIQFFTTAGVFTGKWGQFGNGDGDFTSPIDVASDSAGNVYTLEAGANSRVQKFTAAGAFITKWGSDGSGDGQLHTPIGLGIDGRDNVFVADSGNDRVQKFSSTGQLLGKFGSPGGGDGQFDSPRDVAVGPDGTIYVSDGANQRVQMFTEVADPQQQPESPPAAPAVDTTPPALTVTARKRQKLRKKLVVRATCVNEPCSVTARSRTTSPRTSRLVTGRQTKLTLKLRRKSVRSARKALRKHRRVRVQVKVVATDAAGNRATKTARIRLSR